ncbi:hypothetical protein [Methylobacterium persicinum]|uniref:Uncharacterized protein n=1 Tax=Methylobacterium persicinum TaxID=374426 RepID=A0ABU0HQZ0_9HYPH|nr:hypothetical protein [Methylobacterium persicinum]MDQ0444737.1 hypothetical protein [Methylobacterium persicinum]GJE39705.1 hypothetical protein KHHGKMAE_3791 [Methylobacterium persicinum]
MKKTALALTLAVLGSGHAQAETIVKERFGCHAQQVTERLFQLVQAGDESGFGQLLKSSLASGECKSWKSGDEVALESRTLGYACLTSKVAGGKCYWTPISAIDDK